MKEERYLDFFVEIEPLEDTTLGGVKGRLVTSHDTGDVAILFLDAEELLFGGFFVTKVVDEESFYGTKGIRFETNEFVWREAFEVSYGAFNKELVR